jgi:uncharacterized protein YjiK
MIRHKFFCFFLVIAGNFSCAHQNDFPHTIYYNLDAPDFSVSLPNELDEISGLCYLGPNEVYCVQDEKGHVYLLDLTKGKITKTYEFGSNGDYEGVSLVEDKVFVLKSNGNIYSFSDSGQNENIPSTKYSGELNEDFDAEGLCYDADKHRLLIACKGIAGKSKEMDGQKAIYAFDLISKSFSEKPVFLIPLKSLKSQDSFGEKLADFLGGDNLTFNPSGIAIHPISKELYIIASKGNRLVVLSADGQIVGTYQLPPKIFKQPEGICFDPKGNLIISNEAKGGKANIKVFNYVNKVEDYE